MKVCKNCICVTLSIVVLLLTFASCGTVSFENKSPAIAVTKLNVLSASDVYDMIQPYDFKRTWSSNGRFIQAAYLAVFEEYLNESVNFNECQRAFDKSKFKIQQ